MPRSFDPPPRSPTIFARAALKQSIAEFNKHRQRQIRVCGAGAAKVFAQRGFHLPPGERCGEHDVEPYLARAKAMQREFLRLAAKP